MSSGSRLGAVITALLLAFVLASGCLPAVAGTTGGFAGTITVDTTRAPLAGAKVTLASPSQTSKTTTDARGHFAFVSLEPDTYMLSIEATGYETVVQSGLTITADQFPVLAFSAHPLLREIGRTVARSAADIVRPGQTADVYSVSGQLVQNAQGLGGGGALFQTYAALSSVPGVYVPQNGTNQGQNNSGPYIRGGNFTQVGQEYDGIPITRAYDSYVGNTQGITGQQELQVYTGGGPASSPSESLAGSINQVVKTGTYPTTIGFEAVGGTPTFYHYLRGEVSGATPDKRFTYYVGTTGWNQAYRYGDNFNGGSGLGPSTTTLAPTGNGSVISLPFQTGFFGGPSDTSTRETVANLHYKIPHRGGDGESDDVQVLAQIGRQVVGVYDSVNDLGGLKSPYWQFATGGAAPTYPIAEVYQGPIFSKYNPALATTYAYPAAPAGVANGGIIPLDARGTEDSNNALFKVQYQKNFSPSAYARLYAFSNYSSWFVNDPIGAYYQPLPDAGILGLFDDELSTHTRGLALQFADQLSSRHLLQALASYTYTGVDRWYNNAPYDSGFAIQLRDGSGRCYNQVTGALANCYSGNGLANAITVKSASGVPTDLVVPAGAPAGAQYEAVTSGYGGSLSNQVSPKFTTLSLDDAWQLTDKLKVDLGARYDLYLYALGDTASQAVVGGSNAFYFSEYNAEHCYNVSTGTLVTVAPDAACAAGFTHTVLSNSYPSTQANAIFEPRVSGTYTLDPTAVVRFSAGTYSQPARAAYVQYNNTGDTAAYLASRFLQYGFTTPSHAIPPQVSNNYDLSFEKRLKNIPVSFSFSPFYRLTENQTQAFVLDPTSSFQSGLNVGTLRAFGYELLARTGNFERDGLSAQLAFTYTNSKIRYNNFSGTTSNVINGLNNQIDSAQFNKLTRAGGGLPCYTAAGAGVAGAATGCPTGTLANPYYTLAPQAATPFDPNGWYSPYNLIPTSNGSSLAFGYNSISYDVPEVLTASVQWRKHGLRIVPALQYDAGFKYGSPFAWSGYDPSSGCTAADTTKCATLFRPDPYTGMYDSLGQFKSPGTLSLSLQAAKDLGKGVTLTAIVTNLYQHCFTHGYAWETGGSHVCSYALNPPQGNGFSPGGPYLGNATNAKVNSPLENDPYGYAPYSASFPLNVYISLQVKI